MYKMVHKTHMHLCVYNCITHIHELYNMCILSYYYKTPNPAIGYTIKTLEAQRKTALTPVCALRDLSLYVHFL